MPEAGSTQTQYSIELSAISFQLLPGGDIEWPIADHFSDPCAVERLLLRRREVSAIVRPLSMATVGARRARRVVALARVLSTSPRIHKSINWSFGRMPNRRRHKMSSTVRYFLVLVAGAVVCPLLGCTSAAGLRTPRWPGSAVSKNAAPKKTTEEHNPLKSKPKKDEHVTTADAQSDAKPSGSNGEIQLVSHDTETLKLIDDELKHVPPEERQQLQKDLKSLDSSMVRFVLRNMRMVREAGKGTSGKSMIAAQVTGVPAAGSAAGADTPGPAGTNVQRDRPFAADAGLGAADPWTQNAAYLPQTQDPQPAPALARGPQNAPTPRYNNDASTGILVTPGQSSSTPAGTIPPGSFLTVGHSPPINAQQPAANAAGLPGITPGVPGSGSGARSADPRQLQNQATQVADLAVPPLHAAVPQPGQPVLQDGAFGPLAGATADAGAAAMRTMSKQFGIDLPDDAAKSREELQRLISVAEAGIARTPAGTTPEQKLHYVRTHVHLRMLYLLAGQQERALESIPGIDAADQEFWQQLFWGVANYFDDRAMPNANDRATQAIAQLRSAIQRLQENAKLEISNVNFCHKISSFGSYERFPRDEFSPAQPVLVYAEVTNFKSEPSADGQFRTILRSTIEIFRAGANGELVERFEFPATEDLCRNYRRDYFHSYEFSMPQRISLGPHVLKLTVEDQLSQKVASYTLNFTVK
jgi:hypothetical protein